MRSIIDHYIRLYDIFKTMLDVLCRHAELMLKLIFKEINF